MTERKKDGKIIILYGLFAINLNFSAFSFSSLSFLIRDKLILFDVGDKKEKIRNNEREKKYWASGREKE